MGKPAQGFPGAGGGAQVGDAHPVASFGCKMGAGGWELGFVFPPVGGGRIRPVPGSPLRFVLPQ